MPTNKMHRYQTHERGRPKKLSPKRLVKNERLGGIPMTVTNGEINYSDKVPYGVSDDYIVHKNAILPRGNGNFVRRHIYEMRFNIPPEEEPDNDRRKREYKEWWESKHLNTTT